MNPLSDFMDKAKGLTKNPLGIVALFISLIYGFACLVLSVSLKNLIGQSERLPLIWFIIIFPIFILVGFIYLVVNHHEKLYAPSDYSDEINFIKTIDAKRQTQRIKTELQAIQEDMDETSGVTIQGERLDKQNLQNKFLVAEDLALRALEDDKRLVIKKQGKIIGISKKTYEFDGVAVSLPNLYGIDVKFTMHGHLSTTLKRRIIDYANYYVDKYNDLNIGAEFKLIIVIVTESDTSISLQNELKELDFTVNAKPEFVVYNFNDLRIRFGLE